jgi:hypothetical protein
MNEGSLSLPDTTAYDIAVINNNVHKNQETKTEYRSQKYTQVQ